MMEYQELFNENEYKNQYKEALKTARYILAQLEIQEAGYTALSTPAELKYNLQEQRRKVANLEAKLQTLDRQTSSYKRKTVIIPSSQGIITVEKDRIVNLDFRPLIEQLNLVLNCFCREGVLSFDIRLDNKVILGKYVIPRIEQELKSRIKRIDNREWTIKKILIDKNDLEACGDQTELLVENVFLDACKGSYLQFTDWITESESDLLLIVQNFDISEELKIEELVKKCWLRIQEQVISLLANKSRCFVIIFTHSFPGIKVQSENFKYELDNNRIIPLPLGKMVAENLKNFVNSFRAELHEWGLKEDNEKDRKRIEQYMERLKRQDGDISKTFHELEIICWELQQKGRILFNAK